MTLTWPVWDFRSDNLNSKYRRFYVFFDNNHFFPPQQQRNGEQRQIPGKQIQTRSRKPLSVPGTPQRWIITEDGNGRRSQVVDENCSRGFFAKSLKPNEKQLSQV